MTFSFVSRRLVRIVSIFLVFTLVASCLVWMARTIQGGQLLWFDEPVMEWIHAQSSTALTTVLLALTQLGGGIGVTLLAGGIVGWLIHRRQYMRTWFVVLSVGGAATLNVILKLLFERERPNFWEHLVYETSYSFPSGHAMGSSALAFALVFLLWRDSWRWWGVAGAFLYIAVIGVSRMYLGVHYPSDVFAGWLVSFTWVSLVYGVLYGYTNHTQKGSKHGSHAHASRD